ncbi:hypothetical protein KAR91_14780 [Candidatus Pacearchaeota archaeon]|nr:hypothetical protein [Candidatus Pacearchaeota archaeon]
MNIKNTTAKVIILNGFGKANPKLLCKPGLNDFPNLTSVGNYTKGNKAAKAYFDEGDLVSIPARDIAAEKAEAARLEEQRKIDTAKKAHDKKVKNAKAALADAKKALKNVPSGATDDTLTIARDDVKTAEKALKDLTESK